MPLRFDVIPAVDLMGGRVVRLLRGDPEQKTEYSEEPVAVAQRWDRLGARWLHVVDLDGALTGAYRNMPIAEAIIRSVQAHVELSGGIRTMAAIEQCLAIGAARIILGTKACEDPAFVEQAIARFGEQRIAVALDGRWGPGGMAEASTAGWSEQSGRSVVALAEELGRRGVRTFVVTDITRDGTLQGPNLESIQQVLARTKARVVASGGISSMADLRALDGLVEQGLIGAIVGTALYEGQIDLAMVFAHEQ